MVFLWVFLLLNRFKKIPSLSETFQVKIESGNLLFRKS